VVTLCKEGKMTKTMATKKSKKEGGVKRMKKIALLTLLIAAVAVPAFAFDLGGYTGPVQFHISVYSWGRTYSSSDLPNYNGSGTGRVDTYGLITVDTIDGLDSTTGTWNIIWTPSATERLEGLFWGLSDDVGYVNPDGKFIFNEINGQIELYLNGPSDNPLSILNDPQVPPDGNPNWKPTDNYNATDGQLFLTANFVPGIITGDNIHTYTETIDSLTGPFTGSGHGYLAVSGGAYASMFDTNGYLGGSADLLMGINLQGAAAGNPNWTYGRDPVEGYIIPEPTTMLLLGSGILGLLGMAGIRRKKA